MRSQVQRVWSLVFEMVRLYLHSARGRQRVTIAIGDGMFDKHAPELRWDVRWTRGERAMR